MISYLPIHGTWGADDGWVVNDADPFTVFMSEHGFEPLRGIDLAPWVWSGKINGVLWYGKRDWFNARDSLRVFLSRCSYDQRNLFALSHGGQPAIELAATGFPIRSLTTIGTPRRHDIPAEQAVHSIGIWQHIYDPARDVM